MRDCAPDEVYGILVPQDHSAGMRVSYRVLAVQDFFDDLAHASAGRQAKHREGGWRVEVKANL